MPELQKSKLSSLSILTIAGVKPYQEQIDEPYMNATQLKHFKQILTSWHNELRNEFDQTLSCMKNKVTNFPDPIDRATQEEEFSLELRNREREYKLIKKIEKMLIQIKNETFGYCKNCGIEIGIRRLEARPTAELCIDCKTLAELREKQIAN